MTCMILLIGVASARKDASATSRTSIVLLNTTPRGAGSGTRQRGTTRWKSFKWFNMQKILQNPVLFFIATILTLGNLYSYRKGKRSANKDSFVSNYNYSDFYFCSRPINGNAKRGTNY